MQGFATGGSPERGDYRKRPNRLSTEIAGFFAAIRNEEQMSSSASPEIVSEPLALPGAPEPKPRVRLRLPAAGKDLTAVLVLHGFKGFADWGFFPYLGERLAAAGMAAAGVDFARNGIGERPGVFDRLDLFEENSVAAEIADARIVLAALCGHPRIDPGRTAVIGHSRGGAVALHLAAESREIGAVVGWAALGAWPRRFTTEDWRRYGEQGWLEVLNARTGQRMRIGRRLYQELSDPDCRLDPCRAAAAVTAPLLLVHGDADESVPLEESALLVAARGALPTERVVIPGTGHTFGAVHPFAGTTPALERAIAETLSFLERVLG
jgi:dienelactone hydrolase